MGARGPAPRQVANPELREARRRRGWTEDDVAVALHRLSAELDEPAPAVDANQVSKWERGVRSPGRFYRPRLCLIFEATPEQIGLTATPRLLHDVGELARRRLELERRDGGPAGPGGLGGLPFPGVDQERLNATLSRLWPVDDPLRRGLDAASKRLAERRDTEAPSAVLPALRRLLDIVIELLARPQSSATTSELRRIGAFAGQNAAMASWIAGDAAGTYRTYAIAESLARESRSGSQLALILVDRAEMASQLARATGAWDDALTLSDAAETAALMDPTTPPGVLVWVHGERALQRAMLGDERGSGRDLERMEEIRLSSTTDELNVFAPAVDRVASWADAYHVRAALLRRQPDEAIRLCEGILAAADARLVWEISEALVLLADAWTMKGEPDAAADRLSQAIAVTRDTENQRDMRAARAIHGRMRQRWPGSAEGRRLDEAFRAAQRGA